MFSLAISQTGLLLLTGMWPRTLLHLFLWLLTTSHTILQRNRKWPRRSLSTFSVSVKRYVTALSCSVDVLFGSVFLNLDWNFRLWRAALCVFVCVRKSPVCVFVSEVCVRPGMCVTMFYLLGLTVFCRLQCISGIFRSVKDLCSWWESNREWVRNRARASDIER